MKLALRGCAVLLTFMVWAATTGHSQQPSGQIAPSTKVSDEKLPPHLRPSDHELERAKEMGGEVFKLVSIDWGYDNRSFLGTYYSFKDRSYGASVQISFMRGELKVGGGWSYGFYTDLGERDFREIDRRSQEAAYFLSYKPPNLKPDILVEIERLKDINIGGVKLTRRAPIRVGHTYLLRSIDFSFADTAVVLHVLEMSRDDSLTIIWKKLAEFERPRILFMSDGEMQKKVDAILNELQMPNLRVKIEDNKLIPIGLDVDKEFGRFREVLHTRGIQYHGIDFSQIRRSAGKMPE
jgi:hypothetical protein